MAVLNIQLNLRLLLLPLPLLFLLLQDYCQRGMQLMVCNPSPRVVRLMERSGLINKIGREWVFVRVHDAVVACQRSLMQMEAGGSLGPISWQPLAVAVTSSTVDPLEHVPAAAGAGKGNGGVQLASRDRDSKDVDN